MPGQFLAEEIELRKTKSANRQMGYKLFACARNQSNPKRKKEVTPVRLKSPSNDRACRKRTKGYLDSLLNSNIALLTLHLS